MLHSIFKDKKINPLKNKWNVSETVCTTDCDSSDTDVCDFVHSGRRRTQQRRASKRQDDVGRCEIKINNSNDWDELSVNEMINDAVQ